MSPVTGGLGFIGTHTEYEPRYDTEQAVADYLSWLGAGNPK